MAKRKTWAWVNIHRSRPVFPDSTLDPDAYFQRAEISDHFKRPHMLEGYNHRHSILGPLRFEVSRRARDAGVEE